MTAELYVGAPGFDPSASSKQGHRFSEMVDLVAGSSSVGVRQFTFPTSLTCRYVRLTNFGAAEWWVSARAIFIPIDITSVTAAKADALLLANQTVTIDFGDVAERRLAFMSEGPNVGGIPCQVLIEADVEPFATITAEGRPALWARPDLSLRGGGADIVQRGNFMALAAFLAAAVDLSDRVGRQLGAVATTPFPLAIGSPVILAINAVVGAGAFVQLIAGVAGQHIYIAGGSLASDVAPGRLGLSEDNLTADVFLEYVGAQTPLPLEFAGARVTKVAGHSLYVYSDNAVTVSGYLAFGQG